MGKGQRAVFECRRQRVVPSVQETEGGDNGGNLDNLGLGVMRLQRLEMRGLGPVRHAAAGLCQRQGGALGLGEKRAVGIRPQRLDFFLRHTGMAGTMGGMRLTITAPRRTAGNMGNHLPEAGIQRCIRPDNGAHQREKPRKIFGRCAMIFIEFGSNPIAAATKSSSFLTSSNAAASGGFKCAMTSLP